MGTHNVVSKLRKHSRLLFFRERTHLIDTIEKLARRKHVQSEADE
jgi:hypothetical protein